MNTIIRPKWQHDVNQYLNVEKIICLMGNVYDKCISLDDEKGYCTVPEYLKDLLVRKGYSEDKIKYFDPIAGDSDPSGDLTDISKKHRERPIETLANTVAKDFTKRDAQPTVYIVPNASFFNVDNTNISPEENDAWVKLRILAQRNTNDSKLIFLFSSFSDVPASFTKGQYFIKAIDISMPDQTQRTQFTAAIFPRFSAEECTDVSDASDKLTLERLEAIFKYTCKKNPDPGKKQVVKEIEAYFLGADDNPWFNIPKEKLDGLEDFLNKNIKGQKEVVHQVSEEIKAIANGTSDKLKNSKYAPKAIFFFPGETGVGKTELTKKIAEYILGDEANMIRINCNEYKEAHNPQKLIGAPPGYVGFEQGGQLTNAVRERPYSIVLFDEIEKAHEGIWDYLMNVLSDGRLDDGRGQLTNFCNTIIVFTTNLGATEASETNDNEASKAAIKRAIEAYYTRINRREVFGRIKRGIMTFNKISEETSVEIIKLQLEKYRNNYANDDTKLVFSDEIVRWVTAKCADSNKYGGRDVTGTVRDCLFKGMSDIATNNCLKGATVYIDSVKHSGSEDILFNYRVVKGSVPVEEHKESIERIIEFPASGTSSTFDSSNNIRRPMVIDSQNKPTADSNLTYKDRIIIGERRRI